MGRRTGRHSMRPAVTRPEMLPPMPIGTSAVGAGYCVGDRSAPAPVAVPTLEVNAISEFWADWLRDSVPAAPASSDSTAVPAGATRTASGRVSRATGTHAKMRHARRAKRRGAHAMHRVGRGRQWRKVSLVLGTTVVLILGICGGAAYASFSSTDSGSRSATAGSPITVTVTATTGTADLLPGGVGAAYFTLRNANSYGVTFTGVETGASVVSNDTEACANDYISIAPALPYAFSPPITVTAHTTGVTQSIPNFVMLLSTAPTGCQGVTFTVTLTLSGIST